MFITLVRTDNSPVQLFSRLVLGGVMFSHGAQKGLGWYSGPGLDQSIRFFSEAGLPAWVAVLQVSFELAGSLLLMVGLLTRLWALGFAASTIFLLFAATAQDAPCLHWIGLQPGTGLDRHLLVLGITAGLMIRGGGLLSVDRAITPDNEVL